MVALLKDMALIVHLEILAALQEALVAMVLVVLQEVLAAHMEVLHEAQAVMALAAPLVVIVALVAQEVVSEAVIEAVKLNYS